MHFETGPIIPRRDWEHLIPRFPAGPDHPHTKKLKNQGVEQSCNCFAVASGIETSRSIVCLPYYELDAAEMYSRLEKPGGGTDMGTVIEEAVNIGYKPRGRIAKVFWCPEFRHMMSAVIYGWPIASYLDWHLNYKPGEGGWCPQGVGPGLTHGIMGYKPAMRVTPSGIWEYGIWHQNSAGAATDRRLILSEGQLSLPVGSSGAFAIASIHDEGL